MRRDQRDRTSSRARADVPVPGDALVSDLREQARGGTRVAPEVQEHLLRPQRGNGYPGELFEQESNQETHWLPGDREGTRSAKRTEAVPFAVSLFPHLPVDRDERGDLLRRGHSRVVWCQAEPLRRDGFPGSRQIDFLSCLHRLQEVRPETHDPYFLRRLRD